MRDTFLDSILQLFPEFDQAEIYDILNELKQPYLSLAGLQETADNYVSVTDPWTF